MHEEFKSYKHSCRNIHERFDPLIEQKLGHYVYVLCDIDENGNRIPFYVGKGGGKSGKGNARLLSHFEDARSHPKQDGSKSAKIARIQEVWAKGQDVEWFILRHGITAAGQTAAEEVAFQIENAAIDAFRAVGYELTNEQSGHRSNLIKDKDELYAHAAQNFDEKKLPEELCDRSIFLFPAHANFDRLNDYGEGIREAWTVGHKFLRSVDEAEPDRKPIALAVANGVTRAAILVDQWELVDPSSKRKKWRIVSKSQLDIELRKHLELKNVGDLLAGYWQRGNWKAFTVSSRSKTMTFLRGTDPRKINE